MDHIRGEGFPNNGFSVCHSMIFNVFKVNLDKPIVAVNIIRR